MTESIMTNEMKEYVGRVQDMLDLLEKAYITSGQPPEVAKLRTLLFRALADINVVVESLIANNIFPREYYLKSKAEFYENYLT